MKKPRIGELGLSLIAVVLILTLIMVINIVRLKKGVEKTKPRLEKYAVNIYKLNATLIDLDGNIVKLEKFKGKIVILDFFGTYCAPCIKELVELRKIYDKYRGTVEIVTICVDKKIDKAKEMMKRYGVTWTVVIEEDYTLVNTFEVKYIPTLAFCDGEGNVRKVIVGFHEAEDIEAIIKELIGG